MRLADLVTECAVPPRLDKDAPSGRINIVVSEAFLERLEEWRATLRPIPTKSEAMRMLAEDALLEKERERAFMRADAAAKAWKEMGELAARSKEEGRE